jgi:hypothetical protein
VECDGFYEKGSKSFSYRLCPELADRIFRLTKRTSRTIINHLRKIQAPRSPVVRWLATNLKRLAAIVPPDLSAEDRLALQAINDGAIVWNPEDEFGRRFHSNLTNLRSELRQYLRVDGKPLYQVDIKNSQPLFAVAVLESRGVKCDQYKDVCQSGRLYEHLGALAGLSRADAKHQVISSVFFGRNDSHSRSRRVLAREFPAVWAGIQAIKAADYTELAKLLQRAESDFIIRRVCNRLRKDHPKMFVATIHDSILTDSPENAATVLDTMRDEFAQIDLTPKLEIEPLCKTES